MRAIKQLIFIWLLAIGLIGSWLFVVTPAAAAAPEPPSFVCDVFWFAPVDGNWSDSTRWSTGLVPAASEQVCLDADGPSPYTVVLDVDATVAGFTLNTVDVTFAATGRTFTTNGPVEILAGEVQWLNSVWTGSGALTNQSTFVAAGNSTVDIPLTQNAFLNINGGVGAVNAVLGVTKPLLNNGFITLESTGGGYDSDLNLNQNLLTNNGTIQANIGSGGTRDLTGRIANNGIMNVAITTYLSGTITNANTLNIAPGALLELNSGSGTAVFNLDAGTLTNDGTVNIISGTVNYNGGDISGWLNLVNSTLVIAPSATNPANFSMRGNCVLTGDLAVDHRIQIYGPGGSNTNVVTSGPMVNFGVINIDSASVTSFAGLDASSGPVINQGLVTLSGSGIASLTGPFTNYGQVAFSSSQGGIGGPFANHGDLTVNPGGVVDTYAVFDQNAGAITDNGTFRSNNIFNYSGGAIIGDVHLQSALLTIASGNTNAAIFNMYGSNTISGNIAAAQTVHVLGQSTLAASLTLSGTVTNSGSLNFSSLSNNGDADLYTGAGVLINNGSLVVDGTSGAVNRIDGTVTNSGTISITSSATASISGTLSSSGTFYVDSLSTFDVYGTFNQNGGTLTDDGTFTVNNFFNFNGGSIAGDVDFMNAALTIAPGVTGSGIFRMMGGSYLTGNIAAAQAVWVYGQTFLPASLTLSSTVTNSGSLNFVSLSSGGDTQLDTDAGALINNGDVVIDGTGGAVNILAGTISSSGTISITSSATASISGTLSNSGTFYVDSLSTFGVYGTFNQNSGTLTDNGTFTVNNFFNFNGGNIIGDIHFSFAALAIGPGATGSGIFRMSDSNTLSGNIAAAQTVIIYPAGASGSTLSLLGTVTNTGVLSITSSLTGADTELNATGGSLINQGTLIVNVGNTKQHRFYGEITNSGTISLTSSTIASISGVLTNSGTFYMASFSSFEAYGSFNQNGGTLTDNGSFVTHGLFNFNGGNIVGDIELRIYAALNIGAGSTGTGDFRVTGPNYINGTIAPAQTVRIQGQSLLQSSLLITGTVVNNGVIELGSLSGTPLSELDTTGGTFTNTGTINVNVGSGGANQFSGPVVNGGQINISTPLTISGNLLNTSAGLIVVGDVDVSMSGTLTNNGELRQTRPVTGTGDVPFLSFGGYGGVTLNAQGLDLGTTQVIIRGSQPCPSNDLVWRCFDITPENDTGRNATIAFYYAPGELNGNACNGMDAFHYDGAAWLSAGLTTARTCSGGLYSVTVSGVAGFSPFGLKSGGVPTVVKLGGLQRKDASAAPVAAALMALLAAVTVPVVFAGRNRRRRSAHLPPAVTVRAFQSRPVTNRSSLPTHHS